jgi:hypothetical protein
LSTCAVGCTHSFLNNTPRKDAAIVWILYILCIEDWVPIPWCYWEEEEPLEDIADSIDARSLETCSQPSPLSCSLPGYQEMNSFPHDPTIRFLPFHKFKGTGAKRPWTKAMIISCILSQWWKVD